jgi:hypothetical protein
MTSTSIRVPRAANRDAGSCIDDDLRLLADQMARCLVSRSRWWPWSSLAERLRAFTTTHVMSVVALGAALWMLWR